MITLGSSGIVERCPPGPTSTYRWSRERYDYAVNAGVLVRAAGVPEYWIVDLHREVVHVHRGPAGDGHREVFTAARGDVLTVPGTDLTVDVNELLGP